MTDLSLFMSYTVLTPFIRLLPAPGDAASIIFPKNNGNKLVVKADRAINTRLRINLLLYGF